jgi:hypothetical protein
MAENEGKSMLLRVDVGGVQSSWIGQYREITIVSLEGPIWPFYQDECRRCPVMNEQIPGFVGHTMSGKDEMREIRCRVKPEVVRRGACRAMLPIERNLIG